MKTIYVGTKKHPDVYTLVDDEDFERLSMQKWSVKPRSVGRGFYVYRKLKKRHSIYMHREVLRVAAGVAVDHRDGDGLNNQKLNLRVASKRQNAGNMVAGRASKTSRFKGVSWIKRDQKWLAQIGLPRGTTYIGSFEREEDAARAYDEAALKAFGEFARVNFPTEHV